MPNVIVLYCGTTLMKSLYDKLLSLGINPCFMPSETPLEMIQALEPMAIFISGSPEYVNGPKAPEVDKRIYDAGIPILGICYGMQLMAKDLGGEVKRMASPELECIHMDFTDAGKTSALYHDFTDEGMPTWMLHVCKLTEVPPGFVVTGYTERTKYAAMEDENRDLYAVQFHPEHMGKDASVQAGTTVIWNFLNGICGYEAKANL